MDEKQYDAASTIEQLRAWSRVQNGSMDFPFGLMNWGDKLRELLNKAADEIEKLRNENEDAQARLYDLTAKLMD